MITLNKIKFIFQELILFLIGGMFYFAIETLWRGFSHSSMFLLGGICFLLIGGLNNIYKGLSLIQQMIISSIIITFLELIFGIYLNLILKLNIWDYSNMPFNFLGQICPVFSIIWFFLSLLGIYIDDEIRYIVFKEDKPKYKWW